MWMHLTQVIAAAAFGGSILMFLPRTVHAQSLPVIEVNREVGFAFSDLLLNYKEHPESEAGDIHDRELGWVPSFETNASAMFNLGPVQHIYLSAQFNYSNGSVAYHGAELMPPYTPVNDRSGATFKEIRAELGKGFLLCSNLLVTPTVQFGYRVWNRELGPAQEEDYRHFLLGVAIHVDYAATSRLVLRGRLGWAETLQPAITFNDVSESGAASSLQANLRSRPVWQADGGFDYRVFQNLHAYGNANYSRFSYGQSDEVFDPSLGQKILEPNSSTGSLALETGLALGF